MILLYRFTEFKATFIWAIYHKNHNLILGVLLSKQYGVTKRKGIIRTAGKLRGGSGHNVYVIKSVVTPEVSAIFLTELSPRNEDIYKK